MERARIILAINLQRLRKDKNLTQLAVSHLADLSPSYYSGLESGAKAATVDTLPRLSQALGIKETDLLDDSYIKDIGPLLDFLDEEVLEKSSTSLREAIDFFTAAPKFTAAIIKTLMNLTRENDVGDRKQLFYPLLLRTYQEENNNYFEDIEEKAMECFEKLNPGEMFPLEEATLRKLLQDEHQYEICNEDFQKYGQYPHLKTIRSIWFRKENKPHLLINTRLDEKRRTFELAREIGYHRLHLLEDPRVLAHRDVTSPRYRVRSYLQLWADFRASYFAGALLMPQYHLERDMRAFFRRKTFDNDARQSLGDMMDKKYSVTPETFLHRLSEVLPGRFGLQDLHFMRFETEQHAGEPQKLKEYYKDDLYNLVKYLNMSSLPYHYVESLREKYCRRWGAVDTLMSMKAGKANALKLGNDKFFWIQKSFFHNEDDEIRTNPSLCMTVAWRSERDKNNSCESLKSVTLGFTIDERLKATIRFWDDEKIPSVQLAHTCQRCPINACEVRAAPRVILDEFRQSVQRNEELRQFLATRGVFYDAESGRITSDK